MGAIWTPEAIDLKANGTSGTMSRVGGPRATAHVTVSPSGAKGGDRDGWFWAMHKVLTAKKAEPHYLYDPVTDKLGQYFPLDRSARALAKSNFLPYSHNKVGKVNIQVEVVADTGDFTRYWKPGPNFRAMMRDIRSWGIADRFIFRTADTSADRANVVRSNRLLTSTDGGGVWWGHCHYGDGESHWDPDIDTARFFAGAGPTKQEDDDMQLTDPVNVRDPQTNKVVQVPFSTILARQDWVYQETLRQKAVLDAIAGKLLSADELKAAVKAALDEKVTVEAAVVVKPGV